MQRCNVGRWPGQTVCSANFRITAETTAPREVAVAQHPFVGAHFRPKAKPGIGDKRGWPLRPDAKGCTASSGASGLLRSLGGRFLESIRSLRPSNREDRRLQEHGLPSQTPWWRVERIPNRPSSIDRAPARPMLLWAYGTPDTLQPLRLSTCRVGSVRSSPIRQNRKSQVARGMPRMRDRVGPQKPQQRLPRAVALRFGQSSRNATPYPKRCCRKGTNRGAVGAWSRSSG
jgi:hypothetical protein